MSGSDRERQRRNAAAASARTNEYFVPREGILRDVITADIQRHLGFDALVRPGNYENLQTRCVQQGYFITAYRNLTTTMIADLKADSKRWLAEQLQGGLRDKDKDYRASTTHQSRQYYGPTTVTQTLRSSEDLRPASSYNTSPACQQAFPGTGYGPNADSGYASSCSTSPDYQQVSSGVEYVPPDAGSAQDMNNTHESSSTQPQPTIDLSRSKKLYTKYPNFRRDATIWEHNPGPIQRGKILFDTGCEAGNWVSMRVVKALQATGAVHSLPKSASFLAFDGNPVDTKSEIKLSFEVERTTFQDIYFYVLDNNGPFDMVVGATDCRGYGIVELKFSAGPHLQFFGGLVARGQTQDEKRQAEERDREQRLKEEQHEKERKKREKEKRKKEKREREEGRKKSRRH